MITTAILLIIYVFVEFISRPLLSLPSVTLQSGLGEAITTAATYMANLNNIIPMGTLLTIIGFVVTIEGVIALYKIIMWLIRRLPSQS